MKPLSSIRKFFAQGYGNMASWWTNWQTPGGDRDFIKKYNGYVYACVSAIAEDVAMIKFQVFRKQEDGTLVENPSTSLLKVLDNPNPLMSKYQLIEMTQTHIELTGESFWYSEIGEETKKPKSFYLLPPDRIAVAVDTEAELPRIKGYVFTKADGTKIPLEPEEVTHFKLPNPWDPFRGYGTVEAALLYIQTEQYGAEFTRNYIYNNAMPAGIVSVKGTIDSDEFASVKRQWKQEYGRVSSAGKTAFVRDMDIDFTKVGTTLGEAALKEIKDMSRDDIMTMFRVSKPILGIFEDVNLASAKTAQYVFMSRVIDPKMARIADTLQFVLDRWNTPTSKYVMGYESPVPEDIEDKIKIYQAGINSWLTVDEVRKLEGLEPVDGGSVIRQPLNLIPIGTPPSDTQKSNKILVHRTIKKAIAKPMNLEYQAKENFRQELMSNQEAWAKRYQTEISKLADAQLKQILANISQERAKKLTKKSFDGFMFDDDKADANFISALTPLEYELIKEQGALALMVAGADDLEFQLNEAVKKSVNERIGRMARNFNDETKNALVKELTDSVKEGESIAQVKKRIESVYKDAKGYRAERVARTETLYASNAAAKEGYLQTGYVTKLEWFTNPGACQFCQELHGKVISISQNFVNQGETVDGKDGGTYLADYDNVGHPPLHPNCTCTELPVRE